VHEDCEIPCLELPYHPKIPFLTLLAIMQNVFEAACMSHYI